MILHDVSPKDIAVKLRNYKLVAELMTNVDKTQLIVRHNKNLWVIFMIFKLPWPLRNRYLIAEVQETHHPFLPLITFTINSSNNYDPPFECEVNDFGQYNSEWKIYALDPAVHLFLFRPMLLSILYFHAGCRIHSSTELLSDPWKISIHCLNKKPVRFY